MSADYELLEALGLVDVLEELRDEIRLLRETIGQAAGLWVVQSTGREGE